MIRRTLAIACSLWLAGAAFAQNAHVPLSPYPGSSAAQGVNSDIPAAGQEFINASGFVVIAQ